MTCDTDFHLHSTASDGTLSADELIRYAKRFGVTRLALTDHDTTAGLAAAARAAADEGVDFVPGIELSTTWEGINVHVVGLGIDADSSPLRQGLRRLEALRADRAAAIARRLEKRRIAGALEGAQALAGGASVTRTHIARWLVAQGHATTTAAAHKRFLARGRPGHVPSRWVDIATAIGWVRTAGGMAVLAHPLRYPLHNRKLRCLVEEFAAAGGVGIEVVSGSQSPDRTALLVELSQRHALYASCGSDFHGPEQTWLAPGRFAPLPAGCRPIDAVLAGAATAAPNRVA